MKDNLLYNYILTLGDNSMILGHRLSELCGHGPTLETDIALTNISLDLFGEVRNYFQYAAQLKGIDCTEDVIAHQRNSRQFYNCILVEQPNTDFAYIITRQFLFDVFHFLNLELLQNSADKQLSAIAQKSIKEAKYHLRFSTDWVKRLGDGTNVSHQKMQTAINSLYVFTEELYTPTAIEQNAYEANFGTNIASLKQSYIKKVHQTLQEATLTIPDFPQRYAKGKDGLHTEQLDYILQEFQYMQKAYPNMEW